MTIPHEPTAEAPLDAVLQEAVTALRAPVPARDAARAALRVALAEAASDATERPALAIAGRTPDAEATRSRWQRVAAPRTLRASPLTLAAAAALLVVSSSLVTRQLDRGAAGPGRPIAIRDGSRELGTEAVRFTLAVPGAHQVSLVGDFNDWDPQATALQLQDGTWSVVIPVSPGRHQYGFVVDGSRWIADPTAPQSADTDFGSANSVLYVGG